MTLPADEQVHGIAAELLDYATPVGDVKLHPENARRHNLPVIAESLRTHGQFRPIVANRRTGHILKGNGTYRTLTQVLGWTHVAVSWLDIPAEEEPRYIAVDNRASELGWYNDAALLSVLGKLNDDLTGTGYVQDDLDSLAASLQGGFEPLPPAPAKPQDDVEKAKRKFDLADMRSLVLVGAPDEHDQLVSDLDRLAGDGETPADVVLRLVRAAARARGLA